MSFHTNIPSKSTEYFGIPDDQLEAIKQNIQNHGKDDVLVIIEVDKNNQHEIKNIQIVRGNFLQRAITWISKLIEEFKGNKTYHFGEESLMYDLSVKIDELSKEYQELAKAKNIDTDKVSHILEKDKEFNKTIRSVREFSESILGFKGAEDIRAKTETLYHNHDLAINHLIIREKTKKLAQDLKEEKKIEEEDLIALIEARKALYTSRNKLGDIEKDKDKKDMANRVIADADKDLLEANILDVLIEFDKTSDSASKLLHLAHRDDTTLREQLENLTTLAELKDHLKVLQDDKASDTDFIMAGIDFIEKYYTLPTEIQQKSGLKKQFDDIDFLNNAPEKIKKLKDELLALKAEDEQMEQFASRYDAFVNVMNQLKKASDKIQRQEMTGIQEILNAATEEMSEKLTTLRTAQMRVLQEKYKKESLKNQTQLSVYADTLRELKNAQADTKALAALHQELVSTISTGKGTDVAKLLSVPAQVVIDPDGKVPNLKDLIIALQALVRETRPQSSDGNVKLQRQQELSQLLKAAKLPPIGEMSAIRYINMPLVAQRLGPALEYVEEELKKTSQKAFDARVKAKNAQTLANTPKSEVIKAKKRQLNTITLVEIRLLRNVLGMTKLKAHQEGGREEELNVEWKAITRAVSPPGLDPKKIEEEAEKKLDKFISLMGPYYGSRDHLKKVAEDALAKAAKNYPDTKYQMTLYAIAEDMINRRDSLIKEISEFESYQNPDFYNLDTKELEQKLIEYKNKYDLPHLLIQEKDIIARAIKMQQSGENTSSISSKYVKMIELARAYKYKKKFEEMATNLKKNAEEQEAIVFGWENLMKGLNYLSQTSLSYQSMEEASGKSEILTATVQETKAKSTLLEARQKVIKARQEELGRLLSAQVDLIGAEAVKSMFEHISLYQQDQTK